MKTTNGSLSHSLSFTLAIFFYVSSVMKFSIFFNLFMYPLPSFPLNQCLSYFTLVFTGITFFPPGYLSGLCLSLPIRQLALFAFISVFPSLPIQVIHKPSHSVSQDPSFTSVGPDTGRHRQEDTRVSQHPDILRLDYLTVG